MNCSIIELPVGEHVLSSQLLFRDDLGSLELVGSGEHNVSVKILCAYSIETNYTWYFNRLTSLRIHNIHLQNCPRPLRIDSVDSVKVTNSSFRLVNYIYIIYVCCSITCTATAKAYYLTLH